MESHGGDEVDEAEELSPAEALASTKAARETLARRVAIPWIWHAFLAVGMCGWPVLIFEPRAYPFIGAWPGTLIAIMAARSRRVGVEAAGATSRTSDPLRWWLAGAVVAVLFAGFTLDTRWEHARFVSGLLATVLLFVGLRWLNWRLVSRIRNAT